MSEILTREFLMEELPNLTPGAILDHDAALRAENERLRFAIQNIYEETDDWTAKSIAQDALAAPPEGK